jgi:transposase-like protein
VPKPFPKEFRDDVVNVARGREAGVTLEQIATDIGVHPITLSKWLRAADVADGVSPARPQISLLSCVSSSVATDCWSRRTRFCAGRLRICRRPICREKALPARE